MFFGSFNHNLDEKGRLMIPRTMREEAGLKLFIMKGYDGALAIYKECAFEKLVQEIENHPFNKKDSRAYLRVQLASVCELDVDKLGRIQIPTKLLSKYKIGKEVVVLGAGDHFEVWDAASYEEYLAKAESEFEAIAENLEEKD